MGSLRAFFAHLLLLDWLRFSFFLEPKTNVCQVKGPHLIGEILMVCIVSYCLLVNSYTAHRHIALLTSEYQL